MDAVEGSIDDASIDTLNSRIVQIGRVRLENNDEDRSLQLESTDEQLTESFNQRLRELSGSSDEAGAGPVTGAHPTFLT